jgi:quinol monooxygenase YgiN
MSQPLIYIDTSDVNEGALDELRDAIDELVAFIEANEPQILAYYVYLSDDCGRMTVVHIHADPASFDFHMEVAGPAFRRFAGLLTQRAIRVYGEPSAAAMRRVHEKARMLGCDDVAIENPHGGLSRLARPSRR